MPHLLIPPRPLPLASLCPCVIIFLFCVQAVQKLMCNTESRGRICKRRDRSKEKDVTAPVSVTIRKALLAFWLDPVEKQSGCEAWPCSLACPSHAAAILRNRPWRCSGATVSDNSGCTLGSPEILIELICRRDPGIFKTSPRDSHVQPGLRTTCCSRGFSTNFAAGTCLSFGVKAWDPQSGYIVEL